MLVFHSEFIDQLNLYFYGSLIQLSNYIYNWAVLFWKCQIMITDGKRSTNLHLIVEYWTENVTKVSYFKLLILFSYNYS